MATFMNPGTKFGFTRIFGQIKSGHILSAFLNAVYEGQFRIGHLTYQSASIISGPEEEQCVIHGLFCSQEDGTPIILEWQNKDIGKGFQDRILFFQSKAIVTQRDTVDFWKNIPLFVYILDFIHPEFENTFRTDLGVNQLNPPPGVNPIALDRMTFLQMPEFKKHKEECITDFDRWIYILKNMTHLSEIPWTDENKVFAEIAQLARLDTLTSEELETYERCCENLKHP